MNYSLENAEQFNWSSVSRNLNNERVSHLEKYIIGNKILDAGCGGGAYVEFLAQKGLEVVGIDKYDEFLQLARQNGELGIYLQADITNLPFLDKSFDCTYCFDVFEHVDDILAIKELSRVTSKRLIIAVPQKDEIMSEFGLTFYPYQDTTHLRYYTEISLQDLCQTIDYSKLEIVKEGIISFPSLFKAMSSYRHSLPESKYLRPLYKTKKENKFIDRLLFKLTDVLLNTLLDMNKLDHLFNEHRFFKEVNIGLLAIIDL